MPLQPVDPATGPIEAVRGAVIKYVKAQAMAKIASAAPYLFGTAAGWFFNPIVSLVLDKLLMFLLDKTILGISLAWITIDLTYEIKSAEQAADRLKDMLSNQEKYTADQQKLVEENFDDRAADLIRIGVRNV